MGRKPLLLKKPDLGERIAKMLAAGHYVNVACGAAGVSEASFYSWLEKGEAVRESVQDAEDQDEARDGLTDRDRAFLEFLEAVEKGSAACEVRHLRRIDKASEDGTWQASAWFLERRFPRRWGRFDRVEATTNAGVTDPVSEAALKDREIRATVNALIESISQDPDDTCATEGDDDDDE